MKYTQSRCMPFCKTVGVTVLRAGAAWDAVAWASTPELAAKIVALLEAEDAKAAETSPPAEVEDDPSLDE